MLQLGSELDFPKEAIGAEGGGEFGMQYLQRYQSGVPEIVRQVDRGHAAPAKLALERVAVPESISQRGGRHVGHVRPGEGMSSMWLRERAIASNGTARCYGGEAAQC
jgi:hypothetical protein